MKRITRLARTIPAMIALCIGFSSLPKSGSPALVEWVAGAAGVAGAPVEPAEPAGWALTWSDEFNGPDGSGVDTAKWTMETGGHGWGNNELEYYTNRTQNAYLENGSLVIRAIKENYTGPDGITRNYTSARLKTQDKFSQKFGRFEARIKVPYGQGIWPAFWMLGQDIGQAGWPGCGEIDIMENIGREPSTVHGTIHGPGYSGGAGIGAAYNLTGTARFTDDYHVFAVEWEPKAIRWYVDGNLFKTVTTADLPPGTKWVFAHPFFILLNVAVGGSWPGNPDNSTVFPQSMLVDYVRVYQPKIAITSSASYAGQTVAVESIASAFGNNLATATQSGEITPLPTSIAGTSVRITDSGSNSRLAPLFFVSPQQINYLIPPGTPAGPASVTITNSDGAVSIGTIEIAAVSPGIYSADSTGRGLAAALALRIKPDGSQIYEYISQYDPALKSFTPKPIDLDPPSDDLILVLFGTGIRYTSGLSSVTATIGGVDCQTIYAGIQPDYIGLDQINARIPKTLKGRGEVDVSVTLNGLGTNIVKIHIR